MTGRFEIRAVLFDAAGTLIELRKPAGEIYAQTAEPFGVRIPAWRVADALARIMKRAPAMVFPETRGEEAAARERDWWRAVVRATFRAADATARFSDFDAYFDSLYAAFSRPEAWCRRPGSTAALKALRARGARTAVVSNFDRRLPQLLDALALAPLLDALVLASDAGAAKPDPRIFELALERVGAQASASVFVGDSSDRDIAGARAIGMRAIDVTSLATLAQLPDRLDAMLRNDQETRDE